MRKEKRRYLDLDYSEHHMLLVALNDKRNALIAAGQPHSFCDEVFLKVANCPDRNYKVIREPCDAER